MDMCYDGALVLPSSYAVMNEEEMTYMEGGISVSKYSSGKLFDTYRVHFTAAECSKIALAYGVISGVASIIGALTGPIGAIAGGVTAGACGIAAAVWSYAASKGGLNTYIPILKSGKLYNGKKVATTMLGCTFYDGNGQKGKVLDIMERTMKNVSLDVYDYKQLSYRDIKRKEFEELKKRH